jgi:uncharacterized protein (TIGR03435 family)
MRKLVLAVVLCAQAEDLLKYEVASIRPANPEERMTRLELSSGSFQGTRFTLRQMVTYAYNLRDYQVSGGPKWIDAERYDVRTKPDKPDPYPSSTASGATFERHAARDQERMRNLLKERFQLVVQRETRQLPVYALTVAKGGVKMKPAQTEAIKLSFNRGLVTAEAVKMDQFKTILTLQLGRPVLDETGLTGSFDFKLEWTPEDAPALAGESIFTAIREQLGLKVESKKGPVETIVIAKAEKPSEN